MKVVYTPEAVPPMPVFSQATISRGYVYVSGNIGVLHDLKTIVPGGVEAQTVKLVSFISIRRLSMLKLDPFRGQL